MNLRKATIWYYLKTVAPVFEITEATKPHRWPSIRRVQNSMYKGFMNAVTEYEIKLLKALGLPDINTVRKEALTKWLKGKEKTFSYQPSMLVDLQRILDEWAEELLKKDSVYQAEMLRAYAAGLNRTFKEILKAAPPELRDVIAGNAVTARVNDYYYRKLIEKGGRLIQSRLTKEYMDVFRQSLELYDGKSITEVAVWLHETIGEGQAWHWLRLARTEAVLAMDAAYDRQATEQGVPYDKWSCAANACEICQQFCGKVWRRGEGARPVEDTHPNCACIRYPKFVHRGTVERKFERGV